MIVFGVLDVVVFVVWVLLLCGHVCMLCVVCVV